MKSFKNVVRDTYWGPEVISSLEKCYTRDKENKMDLSIKYIDAILRFIVKRVSRRITLREMRFPHALARFSYPFFLYSARNTGDRKSSGERGERAKGILDPWLLTFRKSLSSIISRGSCFPDVAGKLRQQTSTVYTTRIYVPYVFVHFACVCVHTMYISSVRVRLRNLQSSPRVFIRRSYNTKLHVSYIM